MIEKNSKNRSSLKFLSPFELKDELISAASLDQLHAKTNTPILNAGRGNPNFLATIPRHAFWQLGLFAMREAENKLTLISEGIGGFPDRQGIEARFEHFLLDQKEQAGIQFLKGVSAYVQDYLGLNFSDFLLEMCEGILGLNYPVPDRMLKLSEKIVNQFLRHEILGKHVINDDFDLFAVEGGTAAMTYIFNTLRENFLIKPGDTIALGLPIFTPYIEIPHLNDYQLNVVNIECMIENHWQYSKKELDKLRDPKIKAFFLVNPGNPTSVKMNDESLQYIADILKERPDLILLTDDVYGTFADDFVSLFALAPHNTILVYSYSKYYGATGWRLGTIAMHTNNVLDHLLTKLSNKEKAILHRRYESITTEPEQLKFIDRIVAESRIVALNHTAGLSTPQQVQMVLFSLFSLMDESDHYKKTLKHLIRERKRVLFEEIGIIEEEVDQNRVDYYALLDIEYFGEKIYGKEFINWLLKKVNPIDLLFELAREKHVVLLPGSGFGAQHSTVRVSLANLNEADYRQIGRAFRSLMEKYFAEFKAKAD